MNQHLYLLDHWQIFILQLYSDNNADHNHGEQDPHDHDHHHHDRLHQDGAAEVEAFQERKLSKKFSGIADILKRKMEAGRLE